MLLSQARHDLGKGAYSLAAARVDAALREEASLADTSLDEFFMRATADDFVGRSEVIDALLDYRLAGLHTILFALNGSHLDSALDWSDEFLDRFPGDPGGLTLRSFALEFVGRYDEALIVCEELVERYPDDAASLQRRAAVHMSDRKRPRPRTRPRQSVTFDSLSATMRRCWQSTRTRWSRCSNGVICDST